jgi:hypothetical protein
MQLPTVETIVNEHRLMRAVKSPDAKMDNARRYLRPVVGRNDDFGRKVAQE